MAFQATLTLKKKKKINVLARECRYVLGLWSFFLHCIDSWVSNCPCTWMWNEVWKWTVGKWNASEAHVLISGNQGCSLLLQLLINVKSTKCVGYYPWIVHGAKQMCKWVTLLCFTICSLWRMLALCLFSLNFRFCLNGKRREKSIFWAWAAGNWVWSWGQANSWPPVSLEQRFCLADLASNSCSSCYCICKMEGSKQN